jgi:hypothetical protein
MAEWLDKVHKNSEKIRSISYELENLARGFSIVGNEVVAKDLFEMAKDLKTSEKAINDGVGEMICKDLKKSEETSRTILNAAISGAIAAGGDTNLANLSLDAPKEDEPEEYHEDE